MSTTAAAVAHARLRSEQQRQRRGTPERVSLSDSDTVTVADLVPGDVFVLDGALLVARSERLDDGTLHAHPYADRTGHVQLHTEEHTPVLVFV